MEAIFNILNPNNTLSVNRPLAHAIGALEAIIYGALLAKCNYYERTDKLDDGWFYSTVPDLEESTTLSEYQQKRCIKNLVNIGLIECKCRGMPAKRSFRINRDIELLNALIAKGDEIRNAIKPNAALSYEKKRSSCEITQSCSEETAEQETEHNTQELSPCSEETAEQEAYKPLPLLRRNCGACSEDVTVPHLLYKSKEIKTIDKNQSINQSKGDGTDRIDEAQHKLVQERNAYLALIKKNIEYEYLIAGKNGRHDERVDEIVNIMLDVICSQNDYIRVNGESCPKEVVKSRFLKLNSEHIQYVIMAMDRSASDIRNIRSYLITALYNAPITMDSFYTAMVKYDFRAVN